MTKRSATVSSTVGVQQVLQRARLLPREPVWAQSRVLLWQAGIVVAGLSVWELTARVRWIDPSFWSSPSAIIRTGFLFFSQDSAIEDIEFTFRSTIIGFVIGTVLGAIIGLSFWWSRNYAAVAQPFIIAFHAMPKLALAPLIVFVFGIGGASKIAMAVALTIVISTLTTYSSTQAVDSDLQRLVYSLGATRWQVFIKVIVPSVLPWIISLLRVNIGLSLSGAIVGEFFGAQQGLGRLIFYAGQTYNIALIWVGLSVLAALSLVMNTLVGYLERLLLKGVMHKM
ncbi:ABC transporter permease [Phormidium tenue FACHB-886]|nr:ABC transporter permease [Phormidium tenue FACHB-886]